MKTLLERLLAYYEISEEDYASLAKPVSEDDFFSGHSFKDMDECVRVVKEAILNHKKIFIYGDYDTDGIMAVSILVKMFSDLNYPVDYHIPNRYSDGYGLTRKWSEEIVNNGYDLLITVDNGITAFEGIEYAKNSGLQVLIFDHHQAAEELPVADYILHPQVSGFGETITSAGFVTFMFSYYFLNRYDQYLATLGAISVVSDMMPLVDYNRNLLRLVISQYQNHHFLAIDLLKEKEPFNATTIGMKISPKINSIGRLIDDDSLIMRVVEFFTSDDRSLLLNYNEWINSVNNERKEVSKTASEEVKDIDANRSAIIGIIAQKEGVIGLIANFLVKKYNKPVIIFAPDQSGLCYKGSARSPNGFNIVDAFHQIGEELIENFGGHANAGGCTVKITNFDAFKNAFYALADSYKPATKEEKKPIPLYIKEITFENYELIESFAPFGEGWREPKFVLPRIRVASLFYSRDSKHILTPIGNNSRLTGFNFPKDSLKEYQFIDMIGTIRTSAFYGNLSLEFFINEINETD